jgi:hypothetical protein
LLELGQRSDAFLVLFLQLGKLGAEVGLDALT